MNFPYSPYDSNHTVTDIMADELNPNPLEEFPLFEPIYNNEEIEHLNYEEDRAWNEAFRHKWTTWGHRVIPHKKPEWVHWASRLCTQKMTKRLYNHQLGKAGRETTRQISWGDIAAVLTNPRWTKDTILQGNGLDWTKRAQLQFPQADILKGGQTRMGHQFQTFSLLQPSALL